MSITIKLAGMRFFDREQEFEKLREIEELSHEAAQFTIITGRRHSTNAAKISHISFFCPFIFIFDRLGDLTL